MINSRNIQVGIVFLAGILISIWLGVVLVTDQFETLLKVTGGALLLIAASLGQRVWLMFLFMISANVVVYRWFGTADIGQIIFIGFSGILFFMRKLRFQVQIRELEYWVILIIACILQAYFRNPVGLNILGSGSVGGRPYFVLALWIVSTGILSTLIVPPRELKWALRVSLLGGLLGIPLQMLRFGSLASTDVDNMELEGTRIPSFAASARLLSRWIVSRISPLAACVRPLWALLLLATIALAAASGYRNVIAEIGLMLMFGILYRSGLGAFWASLVIGAFALALLALINLNFPLPGNIQRALSPFPGTWEERYTKAGAQSTEWRIEMWKEALLTDRWITDKIFGDGIGMTAEQLAQNVAIEDSRLGVSRSGLLAQQENMLIAGSYHSGPVHSIRMVGYVGLIILIGAMIRLAVHAHRQILRCRGTEWYGLSLFFGIPQITQPIFFVFVFGEYHTSVAQLLLGIAMIRLMERNLPLPKYVPVRQRLPVPLALRNSAHRQEA